MTDTRTEREKLIAHYEKPQYIGDSVYIHFDGYHFILETCNGNPDDPTNRIAIEPDVWNGFFQYRKELYENFEALEKWEKETETGVITNDNN